MGRNIWQSDYPVPMIKAVRAIVHQRVTVKEAHEIFTKNKEIEKNPKLASETTITQPKTKTKSTKSKKTK